MLYHNFYFHLFLFTTTSWTVICVNKVAHLVQYDEQKKLNFTDLDFNTTLNQEILHFCKLFQMDFPLEVHVVDFQAVSKTQFNEVQELGVRLCRLPRPQSVKSPNGLDCTHLGKSDAEVLDEYETCLVPHINLQVIGMKNNGTVPEDWGFKLGSLYTTHVMLYALIKLKTKEWLGKEINVGLRLWHTTQLKKKDMGMLIAGPTMSLYGVIVPPKQKSYVVAGHCSPDCFIKTYPDGIHIKAVMGHFQQFGHDFCVGQKVRHFSRARGKELKVIYSADDIDPIRDLKPQMTHVHIRDHDQITVECTFNTMNTSMAMAHSINEDLMHGMCYAYLYYYPLIVPTIEVCGSIQSKSTMEKALNLKEIDYYTKNFVPIIKSPRELKSKTLLEYIHSKSSFKHHFESIMRYSDQISVCNPKTEWPPNQDNKVNYPTFKTSQSPDHKRKINGIFVISILSWLI